MSESCNSRHFSWLMKSCFPSPQDTSTFLSPNPINPTITTTLSSLPDDLLLECLSRVPSSSLPSLFFVCRRWSHLLHSSSFLSLRRLHNLLHFTIFAFSSFGSSSSLFAASLRMENLDDTLCWEVTSCLPFHQVASLVDHNACFAAIGPTIYIIGRKNMLCYNSWSGIFVLKSPTIFPRKKFATAVVSGKIYAAGGNGSTVEEYDPNNDMWQVVSNAPRRRYGCIGAAVDGIFYIIGGLKIGGVSGNEMTHTATIRAEANVYASSMDLYVVETRGWLRSRGVPGGGCVVAACAVAGHVYILASHAVELSFWRFDGRRQCRGFGEWCRLPIPPVPAQIRVDSRVRFSCVGVGNKVVLIQVIGSIDDLLRRSGRSVRGLRDGLVLFYDCDCGEWSRGPDLPEVIGRAACVTVEC